MPSNRIQDGTTSVPINYKSHRHHANKQTNKQPQEHKNDRATTITYLHEHGYVHSEQISLLFSERPCFDALVES